ncbi:MAG: hypothetical protein JST26_19145 [Bacteroidetes bacterium]|nr:hypothetical protein [Bacteroidota bacterium]
MIKIRYGIYTLYHGLEMLVTEHYGHGLNDPDIENRRLISYPKEKGKQEGFKLNQDGSSYYKDVHVHDLNNAYFVTTKLIYKSHEFIAWAFNPSTKHFTIYTKDAKIGERMNFIKLSDRYIQEITISEVSKIWEEITKSNLNLALPSDIETYRELDISI